VASNTPAPWTLRPDLSRRNMLIIEDDADSREFLRDLRRCGAVVVEADNVRTARIYIKDMKFDLIVTDLAMPAVAEEPTGFAEFPWGTLRKGLIPICGDPLLRFRGADELNCTERAPQIGKHHWTPTLRFDDDQGLGGYEIRVRPFAYRDLRDIAFAKFGRPADEASSSIGPGERFS
jgi:CheY-like chemotaxis protein